MNNMARKIGREDRSRIATAEEKDQTLITR